MPSTRLIPIARSGALLSAAFLLLGGRPAPNGAADRGLPAAPRAAGLVCPGFITITSFPSGPVSATSPGVATAHVEVTYGLDTSPPPGAPFCVIGDFDGSGFGVTVNGVDETGEFSISVDGTTATATATALPLEDGGTLVVASFNTVDSDGNPTTVEDSRSVTASTRVDYWPRVHDGPPAGSAELPNADMLEAGDGAWLTYTVVDSGRVGGTLVFTCQTTGPVHCDGQTPAVLSPDTMQAVAIKLHVVGDLGTAGTNVAAAVTLTAVEHTLGNTDAASARDTAGATHALTVHSPSPVSLAYTMGLRQERSACPVVGAQVGSPAAVECGDLLYAHGFPGYRTRNVLHALTLLYNSATARARPAVVVDYITAEGDGADRYRVTVTDVDRALTVAQLDFDQGGADSSTTRVRRFVLPIDAASHALGTGAHRIQVNVARRIGGVYGSPDTASGWLPVVDRSRSPFGAGWWPAGVDRLYPDSLGRGVLLVEGDGSTLFYTPGIPAGSFQPPPGEHSSLAREALDGGADTGYVRTLSDHRLTVHYDTNGLVSRIEDVNPSPNAGHYAWTAGGPDGFLLQSITDARGQAITFTLDGTGQRIASIHIPTDSLITLRQVLTSDPSGAIATLDTIVDPDGFPTVFSYGAYGDTVNRQLLLTSHARGAGTYTYSYDAATGHVDSVVAPAPRQLLGGLGQGQIPTRTFAAWQRSGAPTAAAPGTVAAPAHAALRDTVTSTVRWSHSNFPDAGSTTEEVTFHIGPFGAPVFAAAPGGQTASQLMTAVTRDSVGQPIRIRTSAGADVRQVWDTAGNLRSSTTVLPGRWRSRNTLRLATTLYQYDARWNAVSSVRTPVAGRVDTIAYDAFGRRLSETDALGFRTRYAFADDGLLDSLFLPDTAHTAQDDPLPVTYDYDPSTRNLTTVTRGERVTSYFYGDGGLTADSSTDAAGSTTAYTFDRLHRVTEVETGGPGTIPNGGLPAPNGNASRTVRYAFDDTAATRTQTDPLGRITTWTLDAVGRAVQECRPGGTENCLETGYDGLDLTGTRRDSSGRVTTMGYDGAGRVTERLIPASVAGVPGDEITYGYDAGGFLASVTNRYSAITREYDPYGHLVCERQTIRDQVDTTKFQGITTWHDYDADGRRDTSYVAADGYSAHLTCEPEDGGGPVPPEEPPATDPLPGPALTDPTTWAMRGPGNNPYRASETTRIPSANKKAYAYDAAGQLTTLTSWLWIKGHPEETQPGVWQYRYDGQGHVTHLAEPTSPAGAIDPTWGYNAQGEDSTYVVPTVWGIGVATDVLGRIAVTGGSLGAAGYWYDGVGRLVQEQPPGSSGPQTTWYDDAGNRVEDTSYTYRYGGDAGAPTLWGQTRDLGRLLDELPNPTSGSPQVRYQYDARGNLKRQGSSDVIDDGVPHDPGDRTMSYDEANHLVGSVTMVSGDGTCNDQRTAHVDERTFWYDGLGRKIYMHSPSACAEDGGVWRYYWLDDQIALEIRNHDATGADLAEPDLDNGMWFTYGPGTDNVLGTRNGGNVGQVSLSDQRQLYVKDERGSVVRMYCVDVTQHFCLGGAGSAYGAFGSGGPAIPAGMPGYNGGGSTGGLVYMRNRWYDPNTGRFTQEDPIGYGGGINLYGYAGGDPVNYSDPFGLMTCDREHPDDCSWAEMGKNFLAGLGALASGDFSDKGPGWKTGFALSEIGMMFGIRAPTGQAVGAAAAAAEGAAATGGALREFAASKGNSGLGSMSLQDANKMGKAWVGKAARLSSNGKALVSEDGMRTYRFPSAKSSGRVQANLEEFERVDGKLKVIRDGHIDIQP